MAKARLSLTTFITTLLLILFSSGVLTVYAADTLTVDVDVTYDQDSARSMLEMINSFRTGDEAWYWNPDDISSTVLMGSLTPFVYDYDLEKAAMLRAAEIALGYSHTRTNGTTCFTAYSGTYCGENIAAGYRSAAAVFEGWKEANEPYSGQGHRRNMLSSDCTAVGIAHVIYNGDHYWVQEFRSPASGAGKTAAVNNTRRCAVEIAKNKIVSLTLDDISVEVEYGESVAMPEPAFTLRMDEFWGNYGPGKVLPRVVWTIDDTSTAQLQGGKIVGKKVGTTSAGTFYYDPVTKTDKKYSFRIEVQPVSLEKNKAVISGLRDATYNGSAVTYPITVTCKGRVLKSGTDYTTEYTGNINAGRASVTVTGKGQYKDTVTGSFTIMPKELSPSMLTKKPDDVTFTGAAQIPVPEIVDDGVVLQAGRDYEVSYSNNIQPGTAVCEVTGRGNYTGSFTTDFTIKEIPVTLSKAPASMKAKVKKNKVTVSWKKIKKTKKTKLLLSQIKGIQVQYSTDLAFGVNPVTKNIGRKKTKITLKLKRKTVYYIRVRYIGADGVSGWGKVKKVRTR